MKKSTHYLLSGAVVVMLTALSAGAKTFDSDLWLDYCKAKKEKCADAERICEQNPDVNCDKVKKAFMNKRPLDESIISRSSGD